MPSWSYFQLTQRACTACKSAMRSLSLPGSIALRQARAEGSPEGGAIKSSYRRLSSQSPDRPNPLGLHRVKVLEINPGHLHIGPIEAIDGTPVIDIKPVVDRKKISRSRLHRKRRNFLSLTTLRDRAPGRAPRNGRLCSANGACLGPILQTE